MAAREIHIELLLDRRVYALNGRAIGRIEEVRAETRDGECYLTEYLVAVYALFERLAAWRLGRAVLRALRMQRGDGGYRVRWDQLDLSEPERPKLNCKVTELRPIRDRDEERLT